MQFAATPSHPAEAPRSTRDHADLVTRLRDSALFRDYVRAFQALTGLPLTLRAAGSFQPPMADSPQINPLCALLARRSKTCAACLRMQEKLEQSASDRAATSQCFAGLFESAIPVRVGQQSVGYLQTGQILFAEPNLDAFREGIRAVGDTGAAEEELAQAYVKSRVMGRNQYESVLRLLEIFAEHLSALSNQLMLQTANSEAPAITRAKTYISENLGEDVNLGDVARAAGMSSFYFCKSFRKSVGITFTEYVARARVEAVKQLLLNPHKRISEAAFEAGFQSLSQFNRVFQRIAGTAPSKFREKLHGYREETRSHARTRAPLVFAA